MLGACALKWGQLDNVTTALVHLLNKHEHLPGPIAECAAVAADRHENARLAAATIAGAWLFARLPGNWLCSSRAVPATLCVWLLPPQADDTVRSMLDRTAATRPTREHVLRCVRSRRVRAGGVRLTSPSLLLAALRRVRRHGASGCRRALGCVSRARCASGCVEHVGAGFGGGPELVGHRSGA